MLFKDFWKNEIRKSAAVPKLFTMVRNHDASGHSGTGKVLDGVVFPCGKTVVCWDPEASKIKVEGENVNSVAVYDSFEEFDAMHIGQHPENRTELRFLN